MIKKFYAGAQFTVCIWVDGAECATLEFLEELKSGGAPQQKDYETLVTRRMKRMADHGPIRNKEQCKELEDGIFEFKAGNGSRLLWFYNSNQRAVVVCTPRVRRVESPTSEGRSRRKEKKMKLKKVDAAIVAGETTAPDFEAFLAWSEDQVDAEFAGELDVRIAQLQQAAEESPHRHANALKDDAANMIWEAMEARGWSQAELARRLGKSRAYVSRLLGGGENLTLETLARLGEVLDCEWKLALRPTRPMAVAPLPAITSPAPAKKREKREKRKKAE